MSCCLSGVPPGTSRFLMFGFYLVELSILMGLVALVMLSHRASLLFTLVPFLLYL